MTMLTLPELSVPTGSIALVVFLLAIAAMFGSALTARQQRGHGAWAFVLYVCAAVLAVWLVWAVTRIIMLSA